MILNNENKSACRDCVGRCCEVLPGVAFPEDFNYPEDKSQLRQALSSGLWTLDYLEKKERQHYVRPATKGNKGKLIDATWGGECILLSEQGCSLSFEKRPLECRVVVPRKNPYANCNFGNPHVYGNFAAAKAWNPYNAELLKMVEEIEKEKWVLE